MLHNDSGIFLYPPNGTHALDMYNITVGKEGGGGGEAVDPALEQALAKTRFVVQRVLTPLIVGFGVVGNLVNIVVLTRRWMKSSTNCYLTALAVYDILYLVFALSMSFKHYPSIYDQPSFICYQKPFGRALVDTFSNTGVWLTLTFTMERYIGVCHPMKGKRWCTPQRARYVIAAVCLSAALITLPEFFEFVVKTSKNEHNQTYSVVPSSFGMHPSYTLGYININQGLFTFLPLVLLLVFNSLLIRAVLTAARQRRTMAKVAVVKPGGAGRAGGAPHRHQSDQQKITIMLIMVVIVFLLCQLPQAILKLYKVYLQVTESNSMTENIRVIIAANVFNMLVMINAASNFILYSCFSTKFRRTFTRLFCNYLPGPRRSIPEILFTDMTTTNPSPPEESRTHLLRSQGHKGHYTAQAHSHTPSQWSHKACTSQSQDNSVQTASTRLTSGAKPNTSTASAKNGYFEVMQGGKSDTYAHLNNSAL